MRGVSLTLLLGLPTLALLGWLGAGRTWTPWPFWPLLRNGAVVLSVLYLVWALWCVLTLP